MHDLFEGEGGWLGAVHQRLRGGRRRVNVGRRRGEDVRSDGFVRVGVVGGS